MDVVLWLTLSRDHARTKSRKPRPPWHERRKSKVTKKVALALDEKDVLELEMIVRDQDAEEALDFVRDIKRRVNVAQRNICGQGTVTGSQPTWPENTR